MKYFFIWLFLSIPFLLLFTLLWILLNDLLLRFGIKFEYLILIALELSTIVFMLFYVFSPKLLLRWYRAEEVKSGRLLEIFMEVAEKHVMNVKLFSYESDMPNAFYAGNARNGYVVVTKTLEKLLDKEELEAILTAEILHLKNKEAMVYTIAASISGIIASISTLAYWLSLLTGFGLEDDPAPNLIKLYAMSIVAPFASFLIHLVVPGKVEYLFDEECIRLIRNREKMISAMKKMEKYKGDGINFAHAFLFFSNPLHEDYVSILDFNLPTYTTLFKITPGIRKRIFRIEGKFSNNGKSGIVKPLFYSLISYSSVLFAIIAFDTFSRKDFVFERAFMISSAFIGAVLVFLLLLSILLWIRRRSL